VELEQGSANALLLIAAVVLCSLKHAKRIGEAVLRVEAGMSLTGETGQTTARM
jgi:hypothetical protein